MYIIMIIIVIIIKINSKISFKHIIGPLFSVANVYLYTPEQTFPNFPVTAGKGSEITSPKPI